MTICRSNSPNKKYGKIYKNDSMLCDSINEDDIVD